MTDKIRLVTYVDDETNKKLNDLCKKNERKVSQQIFVILKDYLNENNK